MKFIDIKPRIFTSKITTFPHQSKASEKLNNCFPSFPPLLFWSPRVGINFSRVKKREAMHTAPLYCYIYFCGRDSISSLMFGKHLTPMHTNDYSLSLFFSVPFRSETHLQFIIKELIVFVCLYTCV